MSVRGLGLVFYGGEGIGKTGTALQAAVLGPLTCFSIGESGYEDLAIVEEVPNGCKNVYIESWEQLMTETKKITEGVIVIDSLSGIQKILFDYVCRTVYNNDWDKFTSYWKGQRVDCPVFLDNYLHLLDALRHKGVHIILIGHMVTTTESNTLGADYLSHVIDMDQGDKGGLRSSITKWAQAVLFMNIDVAITRATDLAKDRTVLEGKAKDDDNRLIYTTKAPGHSAKNRLKLPPIIPMGSSAKEAFCNLWSKMPQPYQDLL
jgi:hypothetical protein